MSPRLPVIKVKQFENLLLFLGFEVKRRSGSHLFYRHPDGRYTTLLHHGKQEIGRSLTRQILREIGITPEQFSDILKKL
jgi:predicted RNA binding protein YcfA (HicA-like mRNA interferase family)